jgi:hypothetical protein
MEQIDWIGNCEKIVPTTEPQVCPCCDQLVKVYRRNIAGSTAYDLIRFANGTSLGEERHIRHITMRSSGGGDFAKLLYWGLVEEAVNTSTNKRTSGMWRITPKGYDFVLNKLAIPKYALVYNGKFLGFEGDSVTIEDCLGTNFNYRELMAP